MRIALTGNPNSGKQPCTMRSQEEMNVWETGLELQ